MALGQIVWAADSGTCVHTLHGHSVGNVGRLQSQRRVDCSGGKVNTVKLWDVKTGECIRTLEGHIGGIWTVAFSVGSDALASASEDGSIRIWDPTTGKCLSRVRPLKPYEGMDITGVSGLTEAQISSWKLLGVLEKDSPDPLPL